MSVFSEASSFSKYCWVLLCLYYARTEDTIRDYRDLHTIFFYLKIDDRDFCPTAHLSSSAMKADTSFNDD